MLANQSVTSMQRGKSIFNQPNWAATTPADQPQHPPPMSRSPNTAARTSPHAVTAQAPVARTSPAVYQPQTHVSHNQPGPQSVTPAPPKRQLPQRNTTSFPYSVGAKVSAPKVAAPQVTPVNHAPPPQVKSPPVNYAPPQVKGPPLNHAPPQHANYVPSRVNPPLQYQVTPVNHAPPPQVKGPPVNHAPLAKGPPVNSHPQPGYHPPGPNQSTNQPPPSYPQQLSHGKVPPQQAKSPAGHVTGPAPRTGPQQQPPYHIVHNYSTNHSAVPPSNQPGPKQSVAPRTQANQPGPHQPGPNPPRPSHAPPQSVPTKAAPRPAPVNLSRSAPNVTPVNRPPPPQPQAPPTTLHRSAPVKPNESESALDQDTVWALNTLHPFDPSELSIYQPTPATAHKSGDSAPGVSSAEVVESVPVNEVQPSLLNDGDSSFDLELAKFADLLDDNGVVMTSNNTLNSTSNATNNKSVTNGVPSHSGQHAQNKQDVLELQQQNQRLSAEIDSLKHNLTAAEQDRRLANNELAAVKKKLQGRDEECARLTEQAKAKDKEIDRLKSVTTSDAQREVQKLMRQLTTKQREAEGLRSDLNFKEKEIVEAHALKQTMEKELSEYRLQLTKLKQELSSANKSIMDLKRSHDKLQASTEVTRGTKREREDKTSSDEPPSKLAKTSTNNRFTTTTHSVLHDSGQYLTNKLVSVSNILFALPSTLRDDTLLSSVNSSNPRRLSDMLDELCTKLENKTRECLLGHASVESLMQVLEEIVLFKHVALGGFVKVLEVLITILGTSKECRLMVLNKQKKSDRSSLMTVALMPSANTALAQTQNPRISITSAGKTVAAAPSVSAAQPVSPSPHSRLVEVLIDHLKSFVDLAAQHEKSEQQSSAIIKLLCVFNILSWECEHNDLVQFRALLMTGVMEALLNTKRFCHQINALALNLLKAMLSNKSLFEYARTNLLQQVNSNISTMSPQTGTLLERIVVLVSKDQACDYWPRVVRQTAVELLSFIAAYYDEGLDVLLNIVNVSDELRDKSIDQSVYLHRDNNNNNSVDLSIDLNMSVGDKGQRSRLLIDPNKTTAFLSRLVLILFHEFNALYESYHCNPSQSRVATDSADDTIFGEPQRKELIKEIIELLLRISGKLNLKSQLSSVQHQLVSVLTKITQRDIPKELDLVADQAQMLKALLWDYDDLSQVKSQL